jgi:F-type H+-transporting ATPase subunit delta
VINDLDRMVRGGPQVQVARVTTAFPLSESDKEQFRDKLRRKYGQNLEFSFQVDPAIVGGAVIQVGDQIIDASVATRLESLSSRLGVK